MSEQNCDNLREEFERGLRLRDDGDLEGARLIFSQLAQQYSNRPEVFGMLAGVQYQLNRHAEAAQSFRRASELSPDSELASIGLYHSLMGIGDEEAALEEMKRYITSHRSEEYDLILEELESKEEN